MSWNRIGRKYTSFGSNRSPTANYQKKTDKNENYENDSTLTYNTVNSRFCVNAFWDNIGFVIIIMMRIS